MASDDYYGGQVEQVRSSNRTRTGRSREVQRAMVERDREPERQRSPGIAPQVTNQFRDLIADPKTGQLREMATGPIAGPVISPEQWMSQHPMQQLGNLFARALAWPAMMHPEYEYSDPYHAPVGASWR